MKIECIIRRVAKTKSGGTSVTIIIGDEAKIPLGAKAILEVENGEEKKK